MNKLISVLAFIALASHSVSCDCAVDPLNLYWFNTNLAVPVFSGAFNTLGKVILGLDNKWDEFKCNVLRICPKCQNLGYQTDVIQSRVKSLYPLSLIQTILNLDYYLS